jgi:hypothetical protein
VGNQPSEDDAVDENLSRIPFSPAEEETISSMAHWMRFMAVVSIVAGILMIFLVVVGAGLLAAGRSLPAGRVHGLPEFLNEIGGWEYVFLGVFLLAAALVLWLNVTLYHAADYFQRVARTDVADLDFLSRGLDTLRLYFKIQVMVVVATVVASFMGTFFVVYVMPRMR